MMLILLVNLVRLQCPAVRLNTSLDLAGEVFYFFFIFIFLMELTFKLVDFV